MFTSPIVFILGAGASAEVGFPTGSLLKDNIANSLAFDSGLSTWTSGDHELFRTLKKQFGDNLKKYVEAGHAIARVANSFLSVDELLHHFSSRPEVVELGKIAIAREILKAESKSKLFNVHRSDIANLEGAQASWMHQFLSMALGSIRKEELADSFSKVTLINFNYDRSVEHYLYWALRERFKVDDTSAQDLIQRVKILRPYGSVGPLKWGGTEGVDYGIGDVNKFSLLQRLSANIRTYTEQGLPGNLQSDIESAVEDAKIVIFLGFGFHAPNMSILHTRGRMGQKAIFATVHGIDMHNYRFLQKRIISAIGPSNSEPLLVPWQAADMLEKMRVSILGVV
jgi:hypothetical protein